MSTATKKWIIAIIMLWLIYVALKAFGILSYYRLPSNSMAPNYETGKFIMASNLIEPKRNTVVCYHATSLPIAGRPAFAGQFIGRIVAVGGDDVELRDGYVYIDGRRAREEPLLKFLYVLDTEAAAQNEELIAALKDEDKVPTPDSVYLFLDDREKLQFEGHQYFRKFDGLMKDMEYLPDTAVVGEGWSLNNYGPVTVPENHYFILGDSRHNSEDSRMRGFVHERDVVGVVFN